MRIATAVLLFVGPIGLATYPTLLTHSNGLHSRFPASSEPLHGVSLSGVKDFRIPLEIAVIGDKLVLINLPPIAPVQVRAIDDGRLLKNIGAWGNGADDFLGVYHIDPAQDSPSSAWVYDLTRHRVGLVDVSDESLRARSQMKRWLSVRSDAVLTAPTWLGDSLLSPGFFYTGRLAVFGPDGRFARFSGTIPVKENEPAVVTQQAYQAVMRPNPARNMLALATRNAAHLDFYGRDGQRIAAAKVPDSFEPLYSVAYSGGEPKCAMDPAAKYGYLDVAAGQHYVFGLFSGREEREAGRIPNGKVIHVFNWQGELVRVFELPALASAIALDVRHRKLYVVHTDPVPSIVVYDLPGDLIP